MTFAKTYLGTEKQRHHFSDKGSYSQSYGFSSSHVWMWELDCKEGWALKNWCFWTVVLEKTFESPLDCKEIQPVHPKRNKSEYSLEGWRLKLKLQYLGHVMWRTDSLKKTLMLGSSVQFNRSVMSDSWRPHELQHARPPCPWQTPGVYSNSRPLSRWYHPAISSSVVPFSSYPQSFQHQGLLQWVNSSHEVAKVLEFQLKHQSFKI